MKYKCQNRMSFIIICAKGSNKRQNKIPKFCSTIFYFFDINWGFIALIGNLSKL